MFSSSEVINIIVNYVASFLCLLAAGVIAFVARYTRCASDISFVALYRVRLWACAPLALPAAFPLPFFFGFFGLFASAGFPLPEWLYHSAIFLGYVSFAFCLFMSFVWFPRAWTPRWFQRALQAGVPKNSMKEMKIFRKLSLASQERLAAEGNWEWRREAVLAWGEASKKIATIPKVLLKGPGDLIVNGEVLHVPNEEDIFK